MSTDIPKKDLVKQKQNPLLQNEMSEHKCIDDKDSQNKYTETLEDSMNKDDGSEYKISQDLSTFLR